MSEGGDDDSGPDGEAPVTDPAEARAQALELLAATHTFPVVYEVTAIAFSRPGTDAAIRSAAGAHLPVPLTDQDHTLVPSSAGKYTSHRLRVLCATPEEVLDLYGRLRAVDGVVTLL